MKCLVTGAAGFIGSHLCERLLELGHVVVGLDGFIPSYPRAMKEANLFGFRSGSCFVFVERDLSSEPLADVLDGIEAVFHLAAMPGLRQGFSDPDLYSSCNLFATCRLLDALRGSSALQRFVYVSTSSVYGSEAVGDETLPTRPVSHYGFTKLAAENVCREHAVKYGLPLVTLRYFSVYGPRQRPDMGYRRYIQAMLLGDPVVVYGDGLQSRGNTYIDDCVEATVLALRAPAGEIYNVGGDETASVWEILEKLEVILGRRVCVQRQLAREGDQRFTAAETSKIRCHLGWRPGVGLAEGLKRQVNWQRSQVASRPAQRRS